MSSSAPGSSLSSSLRRRPAPSSKWNALTSSMWVSSLSTSFTLQGLGLDLRASSSNWSGTLRDVLRMDVFVLITSIVMPWLIWITTVSLGIVYNEYTDTKKTKLYLPLTPFDNALRTIGPFLPLAPLAMRALGETFAALEQRKIKGSTRRKTHIVSSVVFFGGVQTVRLGVYLLLVKVVFPKSKGTVYPFSDHIFLGLAVSACAQFEAVRSLASFTEIKRQRRSITTVAIVLWALAACCALALATLCALDAHYTARYFHAPIDSAFAMVAGAVLFHVPLLVSLPN